MAVRAAQQHRDIVMHAGGVGLGVAGNAAGAFRISLFLALAPGRVRNLCISALDPNLFIIGKQPAREADRQQRQRHQQKRFFMPAPNHMPVLECRDRVEQD